MDTLVRAQSSAGQLAAMEGLFLQCLIARIVTVPAEQGEPGPHTLYAHNNFFAVQCLVSSGSLHFRLYSSGCERVRNIGSRYLQNKTNNCWYVSIK